MTDDACDCESCKEVAPYDEYEEGAEDLCPYEICHGRIVLGPERHRPGGYNCAITCLDCGATGERSVRTDLVRAEIP